jgi:hypothetical protein
MDLCEDHVRLSVCPSLAKYRRLKVLLDVNEIQYRSSLQKKARFIYQNLTKNIYQKIDIMDIFVEDVKLIDLVQDHV